MLDLSNYTQIKAPSGRQKHYFYINPRNELTVSTMLLQDKSMKQTAEIYCANDGSRIILVPMDEGELKIRKNGGIKTANISDFLTEKKVSLPARYIAIWSEENKAWIGTWDPKFTAKINSKSIDTQSIPKTPRRKSKQGFQ